MGSIKPYKNEAFPNVESSSRYYLRPALRNASNLLLACNFS